MKIGIDISQIVYETGVSWYTRNLVHALLSFDKKDEYFLFGGAMRRLPDLNHFSKDLSGNFTKKFYPLSPMMLDLLWNRLHIFPIENFVGSVDVFHSSNWTQPPSRKAKLVTTVHDLVPLLYPESSHPKIIAVHKRQLKWVKRECERVIAVSEATKNDIITYLGIPAEKISVVYEAPDAIYRKVGDKRVGEVKKKFGLPRHFLLAVGADPRKNLLNVAQALTLIPDAPPLVVVGKRWSHPAKQDPAPRDNILWIGHVSRSELSALYSGAQALIYASLYEGFGLPILEAMACGCPVVTSNISSMPEVAGDAAVLVNPEDVDDIRRGIERVLSKRGEFIKKGLARVKQFSWEKAARETLEVYRSVV
ncbi:MAG: glycosyltransferase family 1 protein [Patescibacteria group bacterium]